MNSINLKDVAIGYDKKVVAQGLDCTLMGGEFTCLIGRNGLGKSTLLRVLAGFMQPQCGQIVLTVEGCDYNLAMMPKSLLSRFVAVVLTDKVDIANVTVSEVVGMGRMPYTGFFGTLRKEDKDIIAKALEMTGISSFADREIDTLSDGERQKVMIARALAQQTPVILLDEPTAFLDYPSKVETMQLLHSLAHDMGKIIVASTHDLDIALRTADRLMTINDGIRDVDKAALQKKIADDRMGNDMQLA